MYLRKLRVRNLKLLRDVEIDFTRGDAPRKWTVLIGENGVCKTTLLQAIALAASGPDRANQLADVPSMHDVRHPDERAEIEAEFGFGRRMHDRREYPGLAARPESPPRLESRLWIEPAWKVFQGSSRYLDAPGADPDRDPLREARAKGLPGWFAAGYGPARALPRPSTNGRPEDPVLGRLDPLFGRGTLSATNFAQFSPKKLALIFESIVMHLLAPGRSLLPERVGVALQTKGNRPTYNIVEEDGWNELRRNEEADAELVLNYSMAREGFAVPGAQGSQGHQATLAWVSDVIGQQLWDDPAFWTARETNYTGTATVHDAGALEGLVLIDELDLHLHPSWQVKIIPALKEAFPGLQFVTTTHSPMVLAGLEEDEVLRLRQQDNGDVGVESPGASPALMTGSELYDTFFEIRKLYPNPLGAKLHRYGYLANDPTRSDEEDAATRALRKELEAAGVAFDWEPVEREPSGGEPAEEGPVGGGPGA